ncbi:MAG: hypothetical protein HQK49_14400 [Oligoflexia bacterium]|nr:hypothetical protein [Oligoflexia bacterium]
MFVDTLLVTAFLLPLFTGIFSFLILKNFSPLLSLRIQFVSTVINSIPLLSIAYLLYFDFNQTSSAQILGMNNFLMVDHLSVFHILLMVVVFVSSSLYSQVYFMDEVKSKTHNGKQKEKQNEEKINFARFTGLWNLTMASMSLVLLSNHIMLIWFALEATTLSTTFLICTNKHKNSVEAMWKYIIICSIGLSIALIGTILFAYSVVVPSNPVDNMNIWLWTTLKIHSSSLNPLLVKIAFIFVVVGYGTKAGLAPMHTWLPDAHGEAPAPISAIFSGFMLNLAVYVILRYIPIASAATSANAPFVDSVLTIMGIMSLLISTVFIVHQKNLKRLLAYCSVEHIGIISLGLGLGPAGSFVALLHTLNHSLSKIFAFYASGMIGKIFNTQEISDIKSVMKISPYWGSALIISLLTLIGVAPFAIFISEYKLVMIAITENHWISLFVFAVASIIIFVAILKHLLSMSYSTYSTTDDSTNVGSRDIANITSIKTSTKEKFLIIILISILLLIGLWMPQPIFNIIQMASRLIN